MLVWLAVRLGVLVDVLVAVDELVAVRVPDAVVVGVGVGKNTVRLATMR